MAKLYFRYGAMGSSKTANAIMVQYNYSERGQNALLLKPRIDDRDSEGVIGSRAGLRARCGFVEDIDSYDLNNYDCVIVDEAQFLTRAQVEKLVYIVDEMNIPVICYGLRADFRGELFEGSHYLMAWADAIEEIKTVCWCGKKATYNARISNGKVVKSGEQILIGGNESYVALCRRHWQRGELAPVEIRAIDRERESYAPFFPEGVLQSCLDAEHFYVLFENGIARAACALSMENDQQERLAYICVEKSQRGRGFGRKLMEYVLRASRTEAGSVVLRCSAPIAPFFEKFGFASCADGAMKLILTP